MGKLSPLASVSQTRAVLDRYGLSAKYSLGQNFLVNDAIIQKTVALAQLHPSDYVLEVGPGIGTLTIALIKRAGFVATIECDPDLVTVLSHTLAPWKACTRIIGKDALDVQLDDLQTTQPMSNDHGSPVNPVDHTLPNKFVANLPYAKAATIVLDYFERFSSIKNATVMVQKEVAQRMAAQPGSKNYGAYTVKLRLHAVCGERFSVGPGNFFPQPRVESSVIRIDRQTRHDETGKMLDKPAIEAACVMADAAFANRRKTILNSCKAYFSDCGETGQETIAALPQIFECAHIDVRRRGETLDVDDFVRLGQSLQTYVPSPTKLHTFA